MSHRNAPFTPEGRRRLVMRCQLRPIAHVAAESGISRQCLSKWVGRYRSGGEAALADRSSAPACRPTRTPQAVIDEIVRLRKKHRWSAVTIAAELRDQGTPVAVVTVTRHLRAHGLNQRRWLDPETGDPTRSNPNRARSRSRRPSRPGARRCGRSWRRSPTTS
ncbi:helix-turn-helix domain-containing protein [Yimella sp. cx-573]|nr:helix-turn-helix domain-containing protein [Yimella sp. cx-573]